MGSSQLGLESINKFGHIMCKEVPSLTVLGTRELTNRADISERPGDGEVEAGG